MNGFLNQAALAIATGAILLTACASELARNPDPITATPAAANHSADATLERSWKLQSLEDVAVSFQPSVPDLL